MRVNVILQDSDKSLIFTALLCGKGIENNLVLPVYIELTALDD
jgi:hypothetical protein